MSVSGRVWGLSIATPIAAGLERLGHSNCQGREGGWASMGDSGTDQRG